MKRIWQHPEVKSDRRYWRSLGEYEQTPEFEAKLGQEFDPSIAFVDEKEGENSRRDFMKIMGGAAALAGLTLTSCRRPLQKVLPFTEHVEWLIPGKPLLYATAMPHVRGATPMVVVTHEGRPTHLQGNPLHPTAGGLEVFAQASILDLYNPDRVKKVSHLGKDANWDDYAVALEVSLKNWKGKGGEGLALLINPNTSPLRASLLKDFQAAYPKAKVYSYEPIHNSGYDAAVEALAGANVRLRPQLDKADRVFSLDCDFLGLESPSENSTKAFMKRRAPEKKGDVMNRIYVVENRYTLTGGVSDHRKPVPASKIPAVAGVLAEEIGKLAGDAALQAAGAALAASADQALRPWLALAAKDLVANKGKSLVVLGQRYGAGAHALVLAINNALGAMGSIIEGLQVETAKFGTIAEFKADLASKKIKDAVLLTDSNPVYDANLGDALKESGAQVTQLAHRYNETSEQAQWILPSAHYLEAWGDTRATDGTYSIVQPMIAPLFNGHSQEEILLALLGRKSFKAPEVKELKEGEVAPAPAEDEGYAAVKASFGKVTGGWDENRWDLALRDGFVPKTAYAKAAISFNAGAVAGLVAQEKPTANGMELVLTPSASLWDGRHIDNPWLQEAPDPITKLTWDNAAWLSPRRFRELGLKKDGDLVKITVGEKSLTIPAVQCPGHSYDSITIPLGYGQSSKSLVGQERGFNAYPLRSDENQFVIAGVKLEAAGGHYALACVQEHYTMEARSQVREGTLDTFNENPAFAKTQGMDSHTPPNIPFYKGQVGRKSPENPNGFDYENERQWGMVIDLGKCLGCSACMIACQSENNIPTVGKDQTMRGRIMHWIRMDRYFATPDTVRRAPTLEELDNPEMINQPVACQQCESAPCETVCPVNATVHTENGLNAMAYNRCIGTRYCANNCPFTARRFNYFDYNKRDTIVEKTVLGMKTNNVYLGPLGDKKPQEVVQLQKNPNVTVRMRGVIEKCTYCVQRLEAAKINQTRIARDDASKLRIKDGTVKVACQASCSADAISFGDLGDDNSAVSKAKRNPRNYSVLQYIGIFPRTSYLARVRNVNPELVKYETERKVPTGGASSMKNSF